MSLQHAHTKIVNLTLNAAAHRWRRRLVDNVKSLSFSESVQFACTIVTAFGIVGGFVMWLSGAFAGATIAATELTALKAQVSGISGQMTRLQDQIAAGPRMDALQAVIEENARQNARMDVLRDEIAIMKVENARLGTRLEGIDAASRVPLRPR